MKTRSSLFVLLALTVAAGCAEDPAAGIESKQRIGADVIYVNADVYTGVRQGGESAAAAVAVADGRILFVGATDAALAMAVDDTRMVDLDGAMMLPGLFDNHVHAGIGREGLMEWEGGLISEVPSWVREARTKEELQAAIAREAERLGPGRMDHRRAESGVWHNGILPTRADLDLGTTSNPVLLTRGPHTTVLNSAALELAGIDRTTTFPGGGHIGHDADGEPNGRLYDSARTAGVRRSARTAGDRAVDRQSPLAVGCSLPAPA